MGLSGTRTYVGFGFGAIQAGLFLYEAFGSGAFSRLVVAEVVPEVVAAVRREEDDLVDALARVLEIDLPSEVERAIRATVGRVAEDVERLDRLPHD